MSDQAEIVEPALLIRIPRLFREGMSDLALYEATRGVWRVGERREQARYGLAVHQGHVVEVFEIHHWQPAGTAPYETRTFAPGEVDGRKEFVGAVAAEPIRSKYLGKSVAHYFSKGSQNPIAYVGGA